MEAFPEICKQEILEITKQEIQEAIEQPLLLVANQEIIYEQAPIQRRKKKYGRPTFYRKRVFKFPCSKCATGFDLDEILQVHIHLHYNKGAFPVVCPVCGKEFDNGEYLPRQREKVFKHHIRQHIVELTEKYRKSRFTCDICGKVSRTQKYHIIHKRKHGGIKDPMDFNVDKYIQVMLEKKIRENKPTEEDEIEDVKDPRLLKLHECETCNRKFETSDILEIHKHEHYKRDEFPTICPVCDYCFTTSDRLSNRLTKDFVAHIKLHTKTKKHEFRAHMYSCNVCGKVNTSLKDLMKHMKKHLVIHDCTRCNRSFETNGILQKHTKKAHTLYRCKICRRATYKVKSGLRAHIAECFQNKLSAATHLQKCRFCWEKVPAASMTAHLKEHIKHKVLCQLCGEVFNCTLQRDNHLKKHLLYTCEEFEKAKKLRSFPCKRCNKMFKCKSTLLSHSATHTHKTHFCNCCQKYFTYYALHRHQTMQVRLDLAGNEECNRNAIEIAKPKLLPSGSETSSLSAPDPYPVTVKPEPEFVDIAQVQIKEEPEFFEIKQEIEDY